MVESIYNENLQYYKDIRKYDQMTPKERAKALEEGKEVDRMPVFMMADLTIPELIGTTVKESETSAKRKAELQIACYRMFGFDGVGMMHGLHSLPIALGGEYVEPEHLTKTLVKPPVTDVNDLSVLDLDRIELRKDEAAWKAFDAIRYIRDAIGEEIDCGMNFTAPFTVAAELVGIEKFLMMLTRDPEKAEELMEFTVQAQFKLAESFLKEGISVGTSDPIATTSIISPKQYRRFAQKYEIKFAEKIMSYTGKPISIHICGNTTKILSDVADCGFSTFSIDNLVDLGEAKRVVGDRMCLVGNVNPVGVMHQGTEEEVRRAVRDCYAKAWDSPKGFRIHTGCDLPYGTPKENMKAYLDEAKKCAIEQAHADVNKAEEHIWDQEL